jgi:FHS family glucose/mannose:H+ symporter-like MFS transporter
LTLVANISFLPIGIVTVLLGPLLPILSARWSLNYSQAGALFPAQYLASTGAVLVSGFLSARYGFRFAMKCGLLLTTASVGLLLLVPKWLGIVCIAGWGAGLGLAVPAANLLVAEVNIGRRGAALNVLNFCWSAGAVSCSLLVAGAAWKQSLPLLLGLVAASLLAVLLGIVAMPARIVEPKFVNSADGKRSAIDWKNRALPALAALFFIYVGVENAFGGWIASYAKSLGSMTATMSLMTPSFFYASLMLGRLLSPVLLTKMEEAGLARWGLVAACAGGAGLVMSNGLPRVLVSASLAGFGLSAVYPITIAMLPREFGPGASRVGSIMFTLSNLGGGFLPAIVGISSSAFGTLKAGLVVPLAGSALMLALYLRRWTPEFNEN